MRLLSALLILLVALAGTALHAGDKVQVALYYAQNEAPDGSAKPASDKLHHRLKVVFGYKHYSLLQSEEIATHEEWEHSFVPRKDFFIHITPQPHEAGQPRVLDYDIYKDGFVVANGKFQARDDTPLFIAGPDFDKGRLILVLERKDKD